MSDETYRWSKKKAEKIFKNKRRYIKKTIEKKIPIYEPLDVETTYREFLSWIQDEDFEVIREIPAGCKVKVFFIGKILVGFKVNLFLNDLIKNFLIERAYYALEEKYIKRRIMNKLGILDPNDIRVLEIVDFIMKGIEKDGLAGLKKFEERCNFKYFLGMVVTRLMYNCWREQYKTKENLEKFDRDFDALFDRPVDDPYQLMIEWEDEELKKEAAEILPQVLKTLAPEEKLVVKWKYEEDINTSAIARALGRTRHKTEKLIKETGEKIRMEILSRIRNKGGKNGTP